MNVARLIRGLPPFLRRQKLAAMLRSLSPSSRIQLIEFNGNARVYADIRDGNALSWLVIGRFEPEFFAIAEPFLMHGGTFFDVGANFGCCTFGLIGALPESAIDCHLFEANDEVCGCLRDSARLYPGVRILVNHGCVCEREGTSRLHVVERHLGASFIAPDGQREVSNVVLDRYVRDNGIGHINFLKIDVEGCEPLVLRGAVESLTAGIVDAVFAEVSAAHLARGGFGVSDVLEPLRAAGFDLYWCKGVDLESGRVGGREIVRGTINGHALRLAALHEVPPSIHTDILAVRRAARLL
jgi:FkbM family methyltransferase